MQYNTSRQPLKLAEYGRSIHQMVEYAVAIQDREERSRIARQIVQAMSLLNPQLREYADYKHKLWDHLFIMSDFRLDCDSPYPMPERDTTHVKPDRMSYPRKNIRLRHYGSIVEAMIAEAVKMEESPARDQVVEQIANFMKMSYLTWNRDSVDDEVIREQLREFSGGKLALREDIRLTNRFIDLREADRKGMRNKNAKRRHGSNGYGRGK